MSASEIIGLRAQILANAKIMLRNPTTNSTTSPTNIQAASSQSTLTAAGGYYGNMDIVVHGSDKEYTAAVMVGLTPAIESGTANTPEGAVRRLLLATADMLGQFIPKLGAHQRAIHGNNGSFDEDLVVGEIKSYKNMGLDIMVRIASSSVEGGIHVHSHVNLLGTCRFRVSVSTPRTYLIHKNLDRKPVRGALDILAANGWDVNTSEARGDQPLLWYVVDDLELVTWCLDHGARTDLAHEEPEIKPDSRRSYRGAPRPTILEAAAGTGNVEISELLRATGAPLITQTLRRASTAAAKSTSTRGSEDANTASDSHSESIAMVRHLVDVVNVDVNQVKVPAGSICSTPPRTVAYRGQHQDYRELVGFLLDRGAKLNMSAGLMSDGTEWPRSMQCAQGNARPRSTGFLDAVQQWQARQQRGDVT